jgi:hypothetical protein
VTSAMKLTARQKRLKEQLDRDPFTEFGQRKRGQPVIDGKPFRRPSTAAKDLDDASGLVNWKAKMVAWGAAQSPMLVEQIRTLDIDNEEDAKRLYWLAQDLAEAGGASDASEYGALIHALLEMDDRQPLEFRWEYDDELLLEVQNDEHFSMIRRMYREEIDRLRFEMFPELVEVPLVSETLGTAGTCDRIVGLPDKSLCVFDLKTNEGNIYPAKFLGWATQLHVYASADYIYDPESETRTELPEGFDRTRGFICVVDRSSCEVEVYEIDLTHGDEILELGERVKQARSQAIQWATKVKEPLSAGPTDHDVVLGRIALLRDMTGFGLDELFNAWRAEGLPKPADLDAAQVERALELTQTALDRASVIPATLDEALKRLANLPSDLRNGVEVHGRWTDRSIFEEETDMARLQAGLDLSLAEEAFEQRKTIVRGAAEKIGADARPAFVDWLHSLNMHPEDPLSYTKPIVRAIDALATAVADGLMSADGGDLDSERVLKMIRKQVSKDKTPVNEECRRASKWMSVPSERGYDAWLARPEIVAFVLYEDTTTP